MKHIADQFELNLMDKIIYRDGKTFIKIKDIKSRPFSLSFKKLEDGNTEVRDEMGRILLTGKFGDE